MGLIAGMMYSVEHNMLTDRPLLDAMIVAQRHRDNGNPVHVVSSRFMMAMSNKHNALVYGDADHGTKMDFGDTFVAVDGIVLDSNKVYDELVMAGYRPENKQATAIIAAAYHVWGLDFIKHLEGEFACALFDRKKNTLLLVRDPYGHKPLHYYMDDNRIVFSSEIKGVLAGRVPRQVDLVSMSDFLTLNGIPYPSTVFKDIMQVEPGSILAVTGLNEHKTIRYWTPLRETNATMSLVDAERDLEVALKEAVRKRMVGKDTFCFLSGGIDSSAILSFAAEQSPKPVKAITVSFNESERDELADAKVMAQHVGATHYHVVAKPNDFFSMLDMLVYHHDSPFVDTSAYPSFYAAQLARQYTDVILTGDGPDQTLAGSSHYVAAYQSQLFDIRNRALMIFSGIGASLMGGLSSSPVPNLLSRMRRALYRYSLEPVERIYDLRAYWPELVKNYISAGPLLEAHREFAPYRHPKSWFNQASALSNLNRYLYADIRFYITDDLMIKVDRMSMAHALETLSPFQDIGLGDLVLRMPESMKLNAADDGTITTKYILKEICRRRFPVSVIKKTKQGFGVPIDKWLRHDGGKYLREILLDRRTLSRGYFHPARLEKMVANFLTNKCDYYYASAHQLVSLITLELWHRKYID